MGVPGRTAWVPDGWRSAGHDKGPGLFASGPQVLGDNSSTMRTLALHGFARNYRTITVASIPPWGSRGFPGEDGNVSEPVPRDGFPWVRGCELAAVRPGTDGGRLQRHAEVFGGERGEFGGAGLVVPRELLEGLLPQLDVHHPVAVLRLAVRDES